MEYLALQIKECVIDVIIYSNLWSIFATSLVFSFPLLLLTFPIWFGAFCRFVCFYFEVSVLMYWGTPDCCLPERTSKQIWELDQSDMVMMEKQTRTDRISNLPWDVLDAILVHLPLKDAARTSILSSKWRYKWISLSQFVFDDKCFSNTLLNKVDRWGEIMKIIHRVQKNHSGPIEKFKLAAYCCPNHLDLDQWMHFLAEKGIKEFVLKEFYFIRRFKLPCCLFSCQQLRHLELYGCTFKLPPEFKGFKCLASLQLRQVCVDSDTLESLILQCPVLERLILLKIDGLTCLKIHNPNLKYLKIYTEFGNIYLENNPLLSSIDIHPTSVNLEMNMFCSLEEWKACNLFRVLGCLSGVKRFSLSGHFLEVMNFYVLIWPI